MSWTARLLPQSLRLRLILSFGVLIFLTVSLTGVATVYLLKDQQEQNAREKVGLLSEPVALSEGYMELSGLNTVPQLEQALANQYPGLRILLTDRRGQVVGDTNGSLKGQTIAQVADADKNPQLNGSGYIMQSWSSGPDQDLLVFIATPRGILPAGLNPQYRTVVAVQASDVRQAWHDLIPRLFLAGAIASFLGVIAAGLLARSISRPMRQMTLASEEMAHGNYEQQLPDYGSGEVGRLARAFNEMARQVSRSHRTLRDFLANVSHELKTPLTSVQGFSQAMTDGSLQRPEDYAEAGRIINDEAVRMRGLVDDLLYLSQVERGEFTMQMDEIAPNELLDATLERFGRRASQAGVNLSAEPEETPQITADGRRLEQALANIVDNAVRHTPSGGTVTLKSAAENGHVTLSVHNTGSVIPPEALPHIFERFYQADPAGARADANTGLGLAITNEIVKAHGGVVEAHSSAEDGTEFVITLPAKHAEHATNERAWARPS